MPVEVAAVAAAAAETSGGVVFEDEDDCLSMPIDLTLSAFGRLRSTHVSSSGIIPLSDAGAGAPAAEASLSILACCISSGRSVDTQHSPAALLGPSARTRRAQV